MTALTVVASGPSTLIQDSGRLGLAHLGVGRAGPMDRAAHDLANRLVGNHRDAAALEIVFGGTVLVADAAIWIAVTGAWGPVTLGGVRLEINQPTFARAGQRIDVAFATHGIRYTLAIRGGLDVAPILGSRSWDSLAKLGPPPLQVGDVLPIGATPDTLVPTHDFAPLSPPPDHVEIDVRPGPRVGWFTEDAWRVLLDTEWRMSPRSDRAGIRLEGPALDRAVPGELPSEGMLRGAIQVSPDGAPTVLAADHPLTGGYPVIAVATDQTVDRLAQCRPGQAVRLRPVSGHA